LLWIQQRKCSQQKHELNHSLRLFSPALMKFCCLHFTSQMHRGPALDSKFVACLAEGRRTNFFSHPFCRINAAFHLATERRIYAAAKNCIVLPFLGSALNFLEDEVRPD